jgi:uncharacterized membrane-anchored protein
VATAPTSLPAEHPLRRALAAEVHSRPPAPVISPAVVSCLALLDAPVEQVLQWLCRLGATVPNPDVAHVLFDLPGVRIKWERHGEFAALTFVRPLPGAVLEGLDAFPTALEALQGRGLDHLPGRLIAAADVALLPAGAGVREEDEIARWFDLDTLAGAQVLNGSASLYTDFLLRDEGGAGARTRWMVVDAGMDAAQSARLVQRVIEIETYRMMALLAFPLARAAIPQLHGIEQQLAAITAATAALRGQPNLAVARAEERRLLDELTRVAAEVESSVAATAFRFSAAEAYWQLVIARVGELREQRIGRRRTIGGFLSRRLAPAMKSCAAAAARQEELSARIERGSSLLRTRVDVAREEQNQRLLEAMDRRGRISLRLQQTVEGLSVAAITYYGAGLTAYLAKPLKAFWPQLNPDWVVAAAIPVLAFFIWRGVRRFRKAGDED